MVLRLAFFILMAVGLLGFGTVAWISTRPPPPAAAAANQPPPPPVTRTVLVAARAVPAGSLLKPEDLAAKQMPIHGPGLADANDDTPDIRRGLVGAMVRRSLSQGDIVRNGDVMRPGDHGFLAAVLAPGMRAVTIAVDDISGSAGLIWPGDHVDVILTENISGPNLAAGHNVAAETVLSNARVIAIDQQIIQGAVATPDKLAKTVTLECSEDQAERISVAVRLGRLSLSVRSADVANQDSRPSSNGKTVWAADVSPALGDATPPAAADVVHVYQGGGDVREFRP
ncbi:MAG TPA: Flp pilus assembly protein CpaB [Acetobacteraceae bacterium]|nr:Flp pilus assembly protein CpaB [Acetobacteraceae bacterium]